MPDKKETMSGQLARMQAELAKANSAQAAIVMELAKVKQLIEDEYNQRTIADEQEKNSRSKAIEYERDARRFVLGMLDVVVVFVLIAIGVGARYMFQLHPLTARCAKGQYLTAIEKDKAVCEVPTVKLTAIENGALPLSALTATGDDAKTKAIPLSELTATGDDTAPLGRYVTLVIATPKVRCWMAWTKYNDPAHETDGLFVAANTQVSADLDEKFPEVTFRSGCPGQVEYSVNGKVRTFPNLAFKKDKVEVVKITAQ